MFGIARLVPWPIWAGAGALLVVGLTTAAIVWRDRIVSAVDLKWQAGVVERRSAVNDRNNTFNRTTYRLDGETSQKLIGNENKWAEQQPLPSSSPAQE